ncbi:MAG: histidine kinase [Ferruginibacter sp.]|nr:histidine kinase [Ferruginibacter sp.]
MTCFQKYLWVIFIFYSAQLSAQGLLYTTTNYTTEQGLAGNEVVKVLQDKRGFIWAATHNGLSKFDGYSFRNYTFNPADTTGLRSIWVTDLALDSLGTIWVSTEWGVAWYDENHDRFRYINDKTEFTVLYKAPLTVSQNGILWFACEDGLYKVNTATKQKIKTSLQRIPDPQSIVEALNGDIWIGTRGHHSLYKYSIRSNTFAKIEKLAAFETMHIMQFMKYSNKLYAATSEGLMIATNDTDFIILNNSNEGICDQLMCITPYQGNYILCGTYNKKLFLFDIITQKITPWSKQANNVPLSVYHSLLSLDKNLWLGTQNGLCRLNSGNTIVQHKPIENIPRYFIQRAMQDNTQKNMAWLLADDKACKLIQYDAEKQQAVKLLQGKTHYTSSSYYSSLLQSKNGDVYCFLNRFITTFTSAGQWKTEMDVKKQINCAAFDDAGNIWLGVEDGLAFVDKNTLAVTYYTNRFTGNDIENSSFPQLSPSLGIAISGKTIWIANIKYGLFSFDTGTKSFSSHRQPFTTAYETLNRCSSLSVSGDTVFVGTMAGLTGYVPSRKKFINYNRSHGLSSSYVYSIKKIKSNELWGRGNAGIFIYNTTTQTFRNIELPPALDDNYYRQQIDEINGRPVVGFNSSIVFFDTAYKSIRLKTLITSAKVNTEKLPLHNTGAVSAKYADNNFEFEFTTIDFETGAIEFSYMLDGLSKKWVDAGTQRKVLFTNLPPGDYTFKVRARKKGDPAYGTETVYPFVIKHALWQHWWFKLVAALILLGGGILFYRWRINNLKRINSEKTKVQQLNLEQYKQQLEFEQIVNFFSISLADKHTQEEVIWDVAKNLIHKLGFANCMIFLWNDDKTVLLQKAGYGPNGSLEEIDKEPFNVELWQGIVGHVAATKKPIMLADTSKDPRYRADVLTRYSELCVPALYDGELISVIDSEDFAKDYYTQQHLQILTTIATMMAARLVSIEAEEDIRRKKEELNKINEQMAQLELASLRSQMNPHFIFNSLNSVQKYIWENKEEDAAEYLAKFAKLMRAILENSRKDLVSLKEEIDVLKIYIELEHRRSNGQFDYSIKIAETLDQGKTMIPPMLMQPFIENAIWHGLNKKQTKGNLNITVERQDDKLICVIDDDGVGRQPKTQTSTEEKKSLGIEITQQRINRLMETTKQEASISIVDKTENGLATGTTVIITLPLQTK